MPDLGAISVSVRWCPLLALAIVTHLVTRLRAGFGLVTWMQNIGTVQDRCCLPSLLRLFTVVLGRGCALGLLYFVGCDDDTASEIAENSPYRARNGHAELMPRICGSILRHEAQ